MDPRVEPEDDELSRMGGTLIQVFGKSFGRAASPAPLPAWERRRLVR